MTRRAERGRAIQRLRREYLLSLGHVAEVLGPASSTGLGRALDAYERRQLGALLPAIRAGAREARRRRGGGEARLTRREVLATLQIGDADLAWLERIGVLAARGDDAVYGGNDLELLEVIDEARRKGLADLFPKKALESYATAMRDLVRFELDLFRRRVLAAEPPLDDVTREATAIGERLVVVARQRVVLDELLGLAQGSGMSTPRRPATSPDKTAPRVPPRPRRPAADDDVVDPAEADVVADSEQLDESAAEKSGPPR